jgi:DNA invertase Pin-like site-specific DNA recombinase
MPDLPRGLRVAIYQATADPLLGDNQRAALHRYAREMGWTIVLEATGTTDSLMVAVTAGTIDLVLVWRATDLLASDTLVASLHAHHVDYLALAQSCSALME